MTGRGVWDKQQQIRCSRPRRASCWLGVLCALVVLVAVRGAAAEPLMIWHAYRGDEKRALEQVLEVYGRRTGREVRTLQVPHDAYGSKLAAAVPRGHGPDLFIDAHERLGDYAQRGMVAELVKLPAGADAFEPRAIDALSIDGKLYGLPLAYKCVALYLNTRLVSEAPASFESIVDLKPRLPAGGYPLVYEVDSVYLHAAILGAFGGRQLNSDGSFGFVGPEAVQSIELVSRLIAQGSIPEEADGALVKQLFETGRAASAISGPWFASELSRDVSYKVVPLPILKQTGKHLRPYLTVEALALTPRGANRADARELLEYLALDPESSERRARVGRQVVPLQDPPAAAKGDAFLKAFAEQSQRAVVMPSSARMRATWEPARKGLIKALHAGVAPEAALSEAQRRFDEVMQPLPPARSPTPLLLVLGLGALAGCALLLRRAKSGELSLNLRRSLPAYRWLIHAVLAVGALVILPIAVGAGTSLFAGRWGDMHYVGIANFASILTARGGPLLASGSFYLVLAVTLLWTVLNISLHVAIGFALGLLLSRPTLSLKPLYRVLLIIPWAIPSYVTALAWKGMFNRQFGAVNALLELVGADTISWWARFSTAFTANLTTNVWLGFPFMMVVTLGALTGVSKEVLEAAEVDGATRWQRLWKVTVPSVMPVMLPAVLLGAVWTFNMFNVVFLVSGGEPDGTTDILVSDAYRWAFTRQARYGYAAAYSVLIFGLLFLSSRLMARFGDREARA